MMTATRPSTRKRDSAEYEGGITGYLYVSCWNDEAVKVRTLLDSGS